MMINEITFFEVDDSLIGKRTFVKIDKGNNEYTTMLKNTYDEMIAAQENPIVLPITTEPLTEQTQEGAE